MRYTSGRRHARPRPDHPVTPRPFIKICCIASADEADVAMAAGASALGLVSAMPSGPGVIDDALIASIATHVARQSPQVKTYLLTSRQSAAAIAQQHRACGTTTLQLVDDVPRDELLALRRLLPHVELVQVIHVVDEASVQAAISLSRATGPEGSGGRPLVDKLLLDSGNPNLAVKELGGTGRVHNWRLSRQIVEASPVPVLLAGGLNPQNVAQALQTVRPHGLDLCSSVRTDGQLDAGKLAVFMAQARSGQT